MIIPPIAVFGAYLSSKTRYQIYAILIIQSLFMSLTIFIIHCYYLINYENNIEFKVILIISIILFALSILFLYPALMPLQTINKMFLYYTNICIMDIYLYGI